jgi:hypothetical protein
VPTVTCPACGKRLESDLLAMDGTPVAPDHMRPKTYDWCDGTTVAARTDQGDPRGAASVPAAGGGPDRPSRLVSDRPERTDRSGRLAPPAGAARPAPSAGAARPGASAGSARPGAGTGDGGSAQPQSANRIGPGVRDRMREAARRIDQVMRERAARGERDFAEEIERRRGARGE